MSAPNDEPRRFELEVEVPGTPEQVWEAIATGAGTECWFIPAEIDEREGGTVSLDIGSGMAEAGVVTAWDRPRRFAYEEQWEAPEGGSERIATEFLVEARAGGTCVVRLVTTIYASGEEWDDLREGWETHLQILRLYLTHFPGQDCSTILVAGNSADDAAWSEMTSALGLAGVAEGQRVATGGGAPPLAGSVERVVRSARQPQLVLRLDEPAPGAALLFTYRYGEQVVTMVHAYLFGDGAAAAAARDRPAWRAWMDARFPAGAMK